MSRNEINNLIQDANQIIPTRTRAKTMTPQQQNQNITNAPEVNLLAPSVKVFMLNPYAADINLSSYDGGKLHMNATVELPEKDKIKVSIKNGPKVRDHFERC